MKLLFYLIFSKKIKVLLTFLKMMIMMMMMKIMMMVNLWYSKILLEIWGTDSIARFSEKPTRCWGSQKCHHFPWWRNGRFHGNRRSYSQRSTREQNRGGNCSVVGEIPQCGSFKGNVVYVNHGPIYDCLFRQCESCTCQIVKVIPKICLKKSFSWSGWFFCAGFFLFIFILLQLDSFL